MTHNYNRFNKNNKEHNRLYNIIWIIFRHSVQNTIDISDDFIKSWNEFNENNEEYSKLYMPNNFMYLEHIGIW